MLDFDLKRPEPLLLVIRHQLVELSLLLSKGDLVLDEALLGCLHSLIDFLFLELLQHEMFTAVALAKVRVAVAF